MQKYYAKAHTSFLGRSGYNNHSKRFFTELNKHIDVCVRNFSMDGCTLFGGTDGHKSVIVDDGIVKLDWSKDKNVTKEEQDILYEQTYFTNATDKKDGPINNKKFDEKGRTPIHIILNEVQHYYFYETYIGPKIAYNVWESTLYPQEFFNKLLEFDQFWVPSEWQKQCAIEQGYPENKIKVIPEGVDVEFIPLENKPKNEKFTFLIAGRWDYRKSTLEMIKAFKEVFVNNKDVKLKLLVDNLYSNDGLKTTQERLNHYDLECDNIEILSFVDRKQYIKLLQTSDVLLSCSRGEGCNLPLIEAIACGTITICSNWGAQLDFAKHVSHLVDIKEEIPAHNENMYNHFYTSDVPGNYCEPDFDHLKQVLLEVYNNKERCYIQALEQSHSIREVFSWENAAKKAYDELQKLVETPVVDNMRMPAEEFFTKIYKENFMGWWGQESRSGYGSEGNAAKLKIDLLKYVIKEYNIKSILDIGSGDFYWMKEIEGVKYTGIDIVKDLVIHNNKTYGNENRRFYNTEEMDIIKNDKFDLVICFDVFGHMLQAEIHKTVNFVNSLDIKYFLVTNRNAEYAADYLVKETYRNEGINLDFHPVIKENFNQIFNRKRDWSEVPDYFTLYAKKTFTDLPRKKLLMITPHLSTGGLPQVFYKKVVNLQKNYNLKVIEYADVTAGIFVVQKNKLKEILNEKDFITLSEDKTELLKIIEDFNPHYIHLEEVPESFISNDICSQIYTNNRHYYITETTHDVNFNISNKRFLPDKFMHVSKYIADKYKSLNVPYEVIEYPIEKKEKPNREEALKKLGLDPEYKHVLNVGLFTPGKNQKQIFEIAKQMKDEKIQFHFVGNLAGNFQFYWQPLMENKPENCIVWGERNDVENFYNCMDLFLFTSTHELNPIVIKEALSYDMPILMNNLEPYNGVYNNNPNIQFLENHIFDNTNMIKDILYNTESRYPSRCYITHTTKNYRETTFGLVYSLLEYSDYPIVIFTINFDISEVSNPFKNNENVYFINYSDDLSPDEAVILQTDYGKYVDRKFDSTYKILSMKSKVLLKSFELGIIAGVYLDSDSVARYNVDDLMLEIKNVKNYPLLSRGVYEVMLDENGNGDIERPLMDYLGVKERSMMYVQSNIVVFTNQCKEFMEEWKKTCEDETILLNFEKWAPYQDETVANVLLWKQGYTEHLPMYHFNIRNPRFVQEFEKFDDTDKSKYSKEMLGFPFYIDGVQMNWSYIPYNKDDVKVFHGIKKLDEMIDIIEYQNRIKKDFCMIQMHDDLYSPLAEITKKVNKEYCDIHGYDYVCYDKRVVDDEKTFHWQRYPMIKRHLRNYKWMFFLDIDAMIMNYNIKLEDLIDNKYDIIMENMGDSTDILDEINKKYADMNYNILASAILLKNSKLSKEFLTDIYNDILHCNNTLQYDNSVVRCTIGYFDKYKKATKVFPCDSKKLNAFWYTNKPSYIFRDGFKWNDMGNMFALGDFILHIVAYNTDERISLAKQFLPYVIKEIKNTTKINILQIGSNVGNTINDPIFSKVDKDSKMILIEPVPYLFNQLKDNYKNKMSDTSNIIFINKAVSNFIGEIELTVPSERNDFSKFPFWASQLASVNSNHATEHLPDIIIDKIKVETTTIDEIINQYNIQEIDLLHTDTEGHDYEILMSYSFKIKPKKILFEHKHIDGLFTVGNKYEELSNKLKSIGYKKVYQNEEDSMFEL